MPHTIVIFLILGKKNRQFFICLEVSVVDGGGLADQRRIRPFLCFFVNIRFHFYTKRAKYRPLSGAIGSILHRNNGFA